MKGIRFQEAVNRPRMRVRCALCDRLVEESEIIERPDIPGGMEIRVRCHGAVDTMLLNIWDDMDLATAIADGSAEGVAFKRPLLESPG